jgi:hypothetical protein
VVPPKTKVRSGTYEVATAPRCEGVRRRSEKAKRKLTKIWKRAGYYEDIDEDIIGLACSIPFVFNGQDPLGRQPIRDKAFIINSQGMVRILNRSLRQGNRMNAGMTLQVAGLPTAKFIFRF